MTLKKLTSVLMPILLMTTTVWMLTGIEQRMAGLGTTSSAQMLLGRLGIALPYATAAGLGSVILFASAGSTAIRYVGGGVASGATVAVAVAVWRELARLSSFADQVPFNAVLGFVDPSTTMGAMLALGAGLFGLRVVSRGNRAFSAKAPKRIEGRGAIHGSSNWMNLKN